MNKGVHERGRPFGPAHGRFFYEREDFMQQTVYLQLEDGSCYEGKSFGAPLDGDRVGEVVFTTAMTGYQETLTDPSYFGQMVVQTFPLIGNYGINASDFESEKAHLSAYIVREWCPQPSNFRSKTDLDTFLKEQGVPGIFGVDTRSITRRIRERGVMNGRLTLRKPEAPDALSLSGWKIKNAVSSVTSRSVRQLPSGLSRFHVVVWDFGVKHGILRHLQSLDCSVTTVPAGASAEEILSLSPDGILLGNGPGDPRDNPSIVAQLALLCRSRIPIFGICLGHQLLALANGADTEKLKYGHRSANQPVRDLLTGRDYITSQNHGYTVKNDSLPPGCSLRFLNLNDGTCEGLSYEAFPGLSVQFHPEACPGPMDSSFLFEEFVAMMAERRTRICH